jgi:hypothetical protein
MHIVESVMSHGGRDTIHGRRRAAVALILLIAGFFFGLASADAARAHTCPTGVLAPQPVRLGGGNAKGQQPDLVITGTCVVNQVGTYNFGQINIVGGGQLIFEEPATPDTNIAFWANSIVVEANGALTVGSAATPYGKNGGFLTIYLYGPNQSGSKDPAKNPGQGVLCKTPTTANTGPCGIPLALWTDNGKSLIPGCGVGKGPPSPNSKCIPGLAAAVSDYFYQYAPLYGDGLCANGAVFAVKNGVAQCGSQSADGLAGYFGYKTLAVSYDGTLQMFGWKGANVDPKVDADHTNSGVSWARLSGDLATGKTTLTLDRSVQQDPTNAATNLWRRTGEPIPSQIVVTTTDYLPTHSEVLTIDSISEQTVTFHRVCTKSTTDPNCPGAAWLHVGSRFPLSNRLGDANDRLIASGMDPTLVSNGAETRAAVALLTRSVRIVSAGDTIGTKLSKAPPTYYFGGHTIFRQGLRQVQIQGVELKNLGQGGKLAHYPIHFHETRLVPADTFVKDSSVNKSMTRWYTIHTTQGVTLQRDVGFKSIGHGYYLEAGPETENNFYADIGILARSAISNRENPRKVPGILADNTDPAAFPPPNVANPGFPYRSDNEYPAVFWITNGWNRFEGNMAAGAEACGAAYWFVPTENLDTPDVPTADNVANGTHMKWGYDAAGDFSYAGLQRNSTFGGATPLKKFYKNYGTSTMMSFQTTPDAPPCTGFIPAATATPPNLPTVREIQSFAPPPVRKVIDPKTETTAPDLANDPYYPHAIGLRLATQCPAATAIPGRPPVFRCNSVHVCADGTTTPSDEAACAVTVLDHYTSAFNWANGNVSGVWLRPQWYLLDNSVLSDVQNGALTFITGGDFTHSSVIQGYWALALDTIFIGHTQTQDAVHAFALDAGPFNNLSGLQCDPLSTGQGVPNYCLNGDAGISMPVGGFFVNQRMMNIYDGPAYQDSNVYLDVTPTTCPLQGYNGACMYGSGLAIGVPKNPADGTCYLPNAAIAWKQPNGFFYPPAFHSTNLFFDNVAIRHYVIDPIFQAPDTVFGIDFDFGQGGTYITDQTKATPVYCLSPPPPDMFNGFTGIDRQTELNDDDGTLTGLSNSLLQPLKGPPNPLKQTISVNDDEFFTAPVETPQCLSSIGSNSTPAQACKTSLSTQAPVTAKTSPYDYVATVVWHPRQPATGEPHAGSIWSLTCSNPQCYGVPLFRQFLAGTNGGTAATSTREWAQWYKNGCGTAKAPTLDSPQCRWPFIRMAGETIATRETLTVNHGTYYLDTTVPQSMQKSENFNQQGGPTTSLNNNFNVFEPGETYTVFFLYLKSSTQQSYQVYVGKDPKNGSINGVRVPIPDAALQPQPIAGSVPWLTVDNSAVASTGVVTVTVDFSTVTDLDPAKDTGLCQPKSFCTSSGGACVSTLPATDPLKSHYDRVCGNWAVKDLDCPAAGCYGFQFTFPAAPIFTADATPANPSPHRPFPTVFPSVHQTGKPDWLTGFLRTATPPDSAPATGSYAPSCYYPTVPTKACLEQ